MQPEVAVAAVVAVGTLDSAAAEQATQDTHERAAGLHRCCCRDMMMVLLDCCCRCVRVAAAASCCFEVAALDPCLPLRYLRRQLMRLVNATPLLTTRLLTMDSAC